HGSQRAPVQVEAAGAGARVNAGAVRAEISARNGHLHRSLLGRTGSFQSALRPEGQREERPVARETKDQVASVVGGSYDCQQFLGLFSLKFSAEMMDGVRSRKGQVTAA